MKYWNEEMFNKIELGDFQVSPFPHVVKEDFMESQYFRALILELKKIEPIKYYVLSTFVLLLLT